MDPVLFYCHACPADRPALPSTGRWRADIWRPHGAQLAPPCGLGRAARFAWVAFHHLRIFRNGDHAMVLIRHPDGPCVHRTLLFPPYFRFPFMAPDDLQCGDIWTQADQRGQGLAALGLSLAMRLAWAPGRRLWYLTEETNEPSCRLALKSGFVLAGRGRRTAPFGLRPAGQFVMTTRIQSAR